MSLDRYDLKILEVLNERGRITKTALAEEVSLSVSPCWERVRRLEQQGVITGYRAEIDPSTVVPQVTLMVEFQLSHHALDVLQAFEAAMIDAPQVVACQATGGGVDYIAQVVVADMDAYQALTEAWLDADLGIERLCGYVVTKTVKRAEANLSLLETD